MSTRERRNDATGHADGRATTPFIFALTTTGILVTMWSLIFVAWLHKRWKRARRRASKTGLRRHRRERESVTSPQPTYIVPPDPAVMMSGEAMEKFAVQNGQFMDTTVAQELYGKEPRHKDHRVFKHSEGNQSNPTLSAT